MANATQRVASSTVPFTDTKIKRPLTTAATYYSGAMSAVNASGYAVKCDDTAGIKFDGIIANTVRVTMASDEAAGDRVLDIDRPMRFAMAIASAVATDINRAVYAVDDQTVGFTSTNSILIGYIDKVLTSTYVLIKPAYAVPIALEVADNTLTFAGSTGTNSIAMPDNLADALSVKQGANSYLTFVTTDAAERVLLSKQTKLADSVKLSFGDADDITMAWDGTDFDVLQATANSSIKMGVSGAGIDLVLYGDTATYDVTWDQSADSLLFNDNAKLVLGTGSDITVYWDATDLLVAQAAADSFVKWGVSGAGINHLFYGDTAGRNLTWDQTNDQLLFNDSTILAIGTGAGGVGDIALSWDATRLNVTQLTTNSEIRWGVDGAGIDQMWYGDTASTTMNWDQSADSLIFTGACRVVFTGTTGQPEMHLTDNLADALSIEISGSTDLMVFTTTDSAESVAVHGLRTKSTTAVAIAGATTLTLADSGGIFTVSQGAAYDIDLPSPTSGPGCSYFFSLTAPAANAVTVTVLGGAATFVGSVITEGKIVVATGATLTFASGTAVLGDSIEVRSIATNLYHVRAVSSILDGITIA
jgi:hypothetical protein